MEKYVPISRNLEKLFWRYRQFYFYKQTLKCSNYVIEITSDFAEWKVLVWPIILPRLVLISPRYVEIWTQLLETC